MYDPMACMLDDAAAHPTVTRRYRVSGCREAEEKLEVEILK